jgi:hypothetical protein
LRQPTCSPFSPRRTGPTRHPNRSFHRKADRGQIRQEGPKTHHILHERVERSGEQKRLNPIFTTGYAALNVSIQPGSFAIFMFKPRIAGIQATSSVTLQQGIRSLFGDTKINGDTVQYFARHEYCLLPTPLKAWGSN